MLLVQGCYEGGEEDYCEFTSDYPSVAEIRRRVRTRTSSLDKSLQDAAKAMQNRRQRAI